MLRELDHRQGDGFEVALDWDDRTGALTVTAVDVDTGQVDRLTVNPAHALDAFRHPYAYAGRA